MNPDDAQRQASEFEEAQGIAWRTGKDLREILQEVFGWDPWHLLVADAYQHGLKPIDLGKHPPDPETVALLSAEIARRYGALPLCRLGDQLIVAVAEAATAVSVCEQLKAVCGRPVQAALANRDLWAAAMDRHYPKRD